jgi:hypothetical protein
MALGLALRAAGGYGCAAMSRTTRARAKALRPRPEVARLRALGGLSQRVVVDGMSILQWCARVGATYAAIIAEVATTASVWTAVTVRLHGPQALNYASHCTSMTEERGGRQQTTPSVGLRETRARSCRRPATGVISCLSPAREGRPRCRLRPACARAAEVEGRAEGRRSA